MKELLLRYRLECIAGASGAIVMIYELVGARMIAPYFGTSLYVWTAIIGVILGALSFGYWYGGKLADNQPSLLKLMKIIVLAAVCALGTVLSQQILLSYIATAGVDVRVSALLASLLLFAPAAIILGIISPYVVKLSLESLRTAGASVGRLYAAGTFGSIVGTFAAGYWLIAILGNRQLGLGIVLGLVALSFLASPKGWLLQRLAVVVVTITGFMVPLVLSSTVLLDTDSAYGRYIVTDSTRDGRPTRALSMDPFAQQSAQYVDDPHELVFDYTQKFMDITRAMQPDSVLMIGGGVFSFPLVATHELPVMDMTVVEIDPVLTPIAKQYFQLQDDYDFRIINMDGRVFLNQPDSGRSYQLIFVDAFSSLTPPYQLATSQAVEHQKRLLDDSGAVVVNIIAKNTSSSPYLAAMIATYKEHFDHVEVYPITRGKAYDAEQNLLLIAANDPRVASQITSVAGAEALSVSPGFVLTDDYAPVEQLIEQQ